MRFKLSLSPEVADSPPSPTRIGIAVLIALIALVGTAVAASFPPPQGRFVEHTLQRPSYGDKPIVTFANDSRGYALTFSCGVGFGSPCDWRLWTTATGGDLWRGFSTPLRSDGTGEPLLTTVGNQGVLVEQGGEQWYSPNHGRTWLPH